MATAERPTRDVPPQPRPLRAGGRGWGAALALAPAILSAASPSRGAAPEPVDFNRDVRPLLSNTCLRCHGPDTKGNPSGLRLDRPEFALAPHQGESGRRITAWVPGKPAAPG